MFCYFRIYKIVQKDLFIVIAFLAHHGCSDLAESDTMSPARAFKHEAFGQPVALALLLHYKSGAVEVRRRQRAAYFELSIPVSR